ncbi:MAG: 50S ribosomal protein L35 [Acidobacteriota bacterium]
MLKHKTHKGAKKRFRMTATGKVKRGHSHARHILTKKSSKRKRKLDQSTLVSAQDVPKVRKMLVYA